MPSIASRRRNALSALLLTGGLLASGGLAQAAPALAGPATVQGSAAGDQGTANVLSAPDRRPSAMRATGSSNQGWTQYRLAPRRVPDRLATGQGFRGEITWWQGGLERRVRVYVPGTVRGRAPLVIALPGLYGTTESAERQQGWWLKAYQQEFVLAWGVGYENSFNAAYCCGTAAREKVDDLAYLDKVLQVVGALQSVDRRRVHLAGYSNGAMLAYRYACGRPGRIAGVLAVAGTMTAPCTPRAATAILAVHGAKDTTVPWAGQRRGSWLGAALPPAGRAAALWRRTGASVRTVVVPRYGHGWPTRADGYDTTGEGWRFLRDHPLP